MLNLEPKTPPQNLQGLLEPTESTTHALTQYPPPRVLLQCYLAMVQRQVEVVPWSKDVGYGHPSHNRDPYSDLNKSLLMDWWLSPNMGTCPTLSTFNQPWHFRFISRLHPRLPCLQTFPQSDVELPHRTGPTNLIYISWLIDMGTILY